MTATDELRALLDERGVEWEGTPGVTFWGNCSALDIATNEKEKVHLHLCCTPEQAIAATLGRGECNDVWGDDPFAAFRCSECGARHNVRSASDKHVIRFCYNCGRRVKGGTE